MNAQLRFIILDTFAGTGCLDPVPKTCLQFPENIPIEFASADVQNAPVRSTPKTWRAGRRQRDLLYNQPIIERKMEYVE
jgi:hypothetical protein